MSVFLCVNLFSLPGFLGHGCLAELFWPGSLADNWDIALDVRSYHKFILFTDGNYASNNEKLILALPFFER